MEFQEVRVRQRPRTFTIIYNEILHDRSLSLKARGLLCTVLSLPDEWDYSIAGLLKIINPTDESGNLTPHPGQGRDALYKILKELELCGYLIRERQRGSAGHLGRTIYTFFDCPQPQCPAAVPSQDTDEETAGNAPHPENPDMDKPDLVNPTQLITKENKLRNQSITHPQPQSARYPSSPPPSQATQGSERSEAGTDDDDGLSKSDQKSFDQLCDLSLKPVKAGMRKQTREAFAEAIKRGISADRIIEAYERYVRLYRLENTSPRFALQLIRWFSDPRGLAWFLPTTETTQPSTPTFIKGCTSGKSVWLVRINGDISPLKDRAGASVSANTPLAVAQSIWKDTSKERNSDELF